jgi:hypothetical protein
MYPDATLTELLNLANEIADDGEAITHDAVQLAELILALDGWITAGGFLPARWEKQS